MTKEALELALEALTYIYTETTADEDELIDQAITTIKESLAQPEQEPVAWMIWGENNVPSLTFKKPSDKYVFDSLYTTPPPCPTCKALARTVMLDQTSHDAQRKPLTEWQPIETAPTTGREFILLLTPSKWPQIAYTNSWWISGFSVENKPTHWMPIPPIEAAHGIKE